jgi:nucleoid-associated protein YgaU
MGLFTFVKNAGEKLFGKKEAQAAPAPAAAKAPDPAAANRAAADAILAYIKTQNLETIGITVTFDGATGTVKVAGSVPDQETKEKIVLCCGNVSSVAKVNDLLTVAGGSGRESNYREVKSGDTLSKIAKEEYGDANAYMKIFEANKPMLSHPDKIYPGQKLRIPAK